jgi:hypothetical protein
MFRIGIVIVLCALAAFGQADANKAQLLGTVLDPNGAAVPNASIKLKNLATGFAREGRSGGDGSYRFVQLDPGAYEIATEASGFATNTFTGLTLTVGAAVNFDIRLQIQQTATTVEVTEALVNVSLPSPSATVNAQAIRDLPINGRRFQDFAALTPTVQIEPQRQQLSFAGQRGVNSNIMVDGADYNQPFFGGIRGGERSNFNFTLPQSAVQEFQAVTSGYAAEYGRSTGGVLNVITKSGTNAWHGDGFYQNRNRELSANNPIFNRKPSETLQQWGGSVGGPLKENKLFVFGAYEQQKADTPRQVLFATLVGFTPTPATQEAFNYLKSQEQPFTQDNRAIAATSRVDYQFTNGDRLTFRYNFADSNENNAVSVGGALNPFTNSTVANEGVEKNRNHFGTANWTKLFGSRVVNDLKFSGSYEQRPRLANAEQPTINAGPVVIDGSRSFLPTTQWDRRLQVSDSLTVLAGKHSLKFGFDYSKLDTAQAFGFNQFGAFNMNTSVVSQILTLMSTAPGQNRFDAASVTYNRQIGNLLADYGLTQMAFFVQDSWRASQRLTLDFGLRWEGQYNPEPVANNDIVVARISRLFPNGATPTPGVIKDNTNQWAPRFGFAWTPFDNNRTVVRGHTGLFYAASPMLLYSGATNNLRTPPGDVSLLLANVVRPDGTNFTVYQQLLAAGVDLNRSQLGSLPIIPVDVVQRASALALGGTGRDPFLGASFTIMAPDFRNPRSFQGGLGVETELAPGWLTGVQFNYVNTVWLHRNRDYNLPIPVVRANDATQRPFFGLTTGTPRPVPQVGNLTVRESSARSLYRGLTYQLQYRGKKFQWGSFYTLQTNYSDDDSERDAGGFNHENSFNFKPEYNYSSLDFRHQYNTYALYQLPWGFEISGLMRVRTGLPLNPIAGTDLNGNQVNNDRPYFAPGVPWLRNSFRNRKVVNNDLRILKSFRLKGESMRVQLSAEFFNLLNLDNVVFAGNTNVFGPGIDASGRPVNTSANFMRLRNTDGSYNTVNQQSGNPFQAQFGVRFFF